MHATTVAVDLAKSVFQVAVADEQWRIVETQRLTRSQFERWFLNREIGLVVMEACGSAHHWARWLNSLGIEVRLLPAQYVRAYVRRNKTDATDAAALLEAARASDLRPVRVKSIEQQSMLCVHRLREGIKEDRTACINRIRGLLAEFGLIFPQGVRELQTVLGDVLEDAGNELGTLARLTLQRAQSQWNELDEHLAWCDERIAAHSQANAAVKTAATLLGIGPVTASAVVATVGDFKQFRNGAQFGAWIGLTPRQRSSGGKNNLGGITKRGDTYLRTLLIQGAKSAVMTAHRRQDKISQWAAALRERSGWQKAVVALANKNARILWAVMTRGEAFDVNHLSVKPASA